MNSTEQKHEHRKYLQSVHLVSCFWPFMMHQGAFPSSKSTSIDVNVVLENIDLSSNPHTQRHKSTSSLSVKKLQLSIHVPFQVP